MKGFGNRWDIRISSLGLALLLAPVVFARDPAPRFGIMKNVQLAPAAARGVVIPVGSAVSTGAVSSLDGLSGDVTLVGGANVSILNLSGNRIQITAAPPGAGGAVVHDLTLTGDGTTTSPLGVETNYFGSNSVSVFQVTNTLAGDWQHNGAAIRGLFHGPSGVTANGHGVPVGAGVIGDSVDGIGVVGLGGGSAPGVVAKSLFGPGIYSESGGDTAVIGISNRQGGIGVYGLDNVQGGIGIYGEGGPDGHAGAFNGNVTKSGGSFKIDHPLDPARKYLYHSFVESPDMMNVYNGNATLDAGGAAVVELPDWFGALNRDYRYQLTSIGAPQPGLYVAVEVTDNRFVISGGQPGGRVSWQVTGIRQDPWANAHRIPVEEEKAEPDQGYYLHPELYGQPPEKSLSPLNRAHRGIPR